MRAPRLRFAGEALAISLFIKYKSNDGCKINDEASCGQIKPNVMRFTHAVCVARSMDGKMAIAVEGKHVAAACIFGAAEKNAGASKAGCHISAGRFYAVFDKGAWRHKQFKLTKSWLNVPVKEPDSALLVFGQGKRRRVPLHMEHEIRLNIMLLLVNEVAKMMSSHRDYLVFLTHRLAHINAHELGVGVDGKRLDRRVRGAGKCGHCVRRGKLLRSAGKSVGVFALDACGDMNTIGHSDPGPFGTLWMHPRSLRARSRRCPLEPKRLPLTSAPENRLWGCM